MLDEKTLEVWNLDPEEPVEVYIDGKKVELYEPVKTDKTGYAKVVLVEPVAKGAHDVLVHTSRKAWYGKAVA